MRDYAAARVGIEGLVVKGAGTSYESGKRGWVKYRIRDTVEAVVGAVTGSLEQPGSLVLSYYDTVGDLVVAGSTTPLTRRQQDLVAAHLRASVGGHPWPDRIGSGRLGHWGGPPRAVTRVDPVLVVEISADTAVTAGRLAPHHQVHPGPPGPQCRRRPATVLTGCAVCSVVRRACGDDGILPVRACRN